MNKPQAEGSASVSLMSPLNIGTRELSVNKRENKVTLHKKHVTQIVTRKFNCKFKSNALLY